MTTHCYIIAFLLMFYANHLHIFGLWRAFHVEFMNDENPKAGIVKGSENIFSFITIWTVKTFGTFYSKPLTTCPICMASFHSTYIYWPMMLIVGFKPWMIPLWFIYMTCLAGLNWLKMEEVS